MRIRGHIGDWPVDLTLELEPEEWAQLGRQPEPSAIGETVQASTRPAIPRNDDHWTAACDLLRQAGAWEGPVLLARLEALVGNAAGAKRLLVRLRHSPQVKVESAADAPVFRWVGPDRPS
ncbi:hypothetical protein [Pseudomonas phoenicis]|uniref:hypothetical protein n=1 Tax=unclassified Pseudomonas TaxID=196821 RepID=UPI0039A295A9